MNAPTRQPPSIGSGSPQWAGQRRWFSHELFGSTQEILIEHAGQEYRLRITRQGKLILTK